MVISPIANKSFCIIEENKKSKKFKNLHEKSNGIDCSRLFIANFFVRKFAIFIFNNFHSFACYNAKFNVIFLNSNMTQKIDEDKYISLIPATLSHESLHMIIRHLINKKASIGLDDFLEKKKRYDLKLIDISGL